MRHRQTAPSTFRKLNPHINFAGLSLTFHRRPKEWKPPGRRGRRSPIRRAGISLRSARGANAHLILEEFVGPDRRIRQLGRVSKGLPPSPTGEDAGSGLHSGGAIVEVFSAAGASLGPAQILPYFTRSRSVANRVSENAPLPWWQTMSPEALANAYSKFLAGEMAAGNPARQRTGRITGPAPSCYRREGRKCSSTLDSSAKVDKLARSLGLRWAGRAGKLHPNQRRVPLRPTYPFAGERHWAPDHVQKNSATRK